MKQGLTISQLAAELERQESAKADYIAPTDQMHFVTTALDAPVGAGISELDFVGEGSGPETAGMAVLEHAERQLAGHLKIPWGFYDRLHKELPGLLDENVNRLLRHNPKPRMVRTLDGNVRAFMSDRYRRLDNAELARVLFPVLGDIPDVKIMSTEITDTRMYIKAVTPRVTGEVKVGEEVQAGVLIANSEVGSGKLRVEPFIYTLACTNGMVVSRELGGAAMRRVHVGRRLESDEDFRIFRDETLQADDRAFFMACADVVRAAVDEVRFRDLLETMRAAAEDTPVKSVAGGIQLLAKNEGLDDAEAESVLTHLAAGGDLSRWGMLSAITRAAEDVESYDRATELEEMGGKVLAYSPAQWRAVTEAVAA